VAQPQAPEQQEKAESDQIGHAIPMDGQRPHLQGNRIDVGVNQHAWTLVTVAESRRKKMLGCAQSSSERSRTAPLSADMTSLA
jgi:hypothetical protein